MDRLAALEAFAKVAETKSFSEAARRLRASKSVVSRQIAALEAELGVRLFQRTTRSMTLTEAGRGYFQRASRILADLEEANFSVSQSIQPLAPKDAGGDSIIQSAAVFNYLILYGGNPAIGAGDNEAPVFTTLVKGPASSCAVAGEGVTAVPFLFSAIGLALWMRRRRSR